MRYLLSKNFTESGPYDIGVLEDMAKSGNIGQGHWVCKEGSSNWVEITQMTELKSVFGAQSKPKSTAAAKKSPPPKKK